LPFIAILSGWVTAEVGRQPWVVYGVLRTADALTPFLSAQTVLVSLAVYGTVYTFIFTFGTYYIYRLLRTGPVGSLGLPPIGAVPNRPMSVIDEQRAMPTSRHLPAGE
jgi:cytochrome d ubiquinol oxidase subunit I